MKAKTRNYIKKTMTQNTLAEGLTYAQHDALHILCKYRHALHSNMGAVMCGGEDGRKLENFFRYALPVMLRTSNLPNLDVLAEFDALADCAKIGDGCYTGTVKKALLETVNMKVETYLRRIDLRNGTNYAPSGYARLSQVEI